MWEILFFAILASFGLSKGCDPSQTTVSGTHAPSGNLCSGQLIFEDNFDKLEEGKWQYEKTLAGGGNWEFQWYLENKTNSYVNNGIFNIKPTLVADDFGEDFLYSGTIVVDGCTNPDSFGCKRTGTSTNILNPIKSTRIHSVNSFSFKYGKVEIRAKIPAGDWLWPAIWMMPRYNKYSDWPTSGEIDIMESRGNRHLIQAGTGQNIGVQQVASTLHWGPDRQHNRFDLTHYERNSPVGYDNAFHNYQLEWTPEKLTFSVDGSPIGSVSPPEGGFWELGHFEETGLKNPWEGKRMAPFDEEFYIIINLAIGGTNFFPDDATNSPGGKPWKNTSPTAMTDFWKGKQQWSPTWDSVGDTSHLQVDYVRVWAL